VGAHLLPHPARHHRRRGHGHRGGPPQQVVARWTRPALRPPPTVSLPPSTMLLVLVGSLLCPLLSSRSTLVLDAPPCTPPSPPLLGDASMHTHTYT
jgi:hypothetical protein